MVGYCIMRWIDKNLDDIFKKDGINAVKIKYTSFFEDFSNMKIEYLVDKLNSR